MHDESFKELKLRATRITADPWASEDAELEARARASEAYHDHPSHPSSCLAYKEHYGSQCPCENAWREYIKNEQETG